MTEKLEDRVLRGHHSTVFGNCPQLEFFMRRLLTLLLLCPITVFAEKTYEYHLNNGLTVIVRPDPRAPVVLSSIWYKVGGSYEQDGMTGVSHMLEHMMFKGTKKYAPGALVKIVTENGGEQNAMTSEDFTAYYQFWSVDKLPLSFQFESDRMHNLMLNQDLYDKEHQVVMEERRMRVDDDPQATTFERFNAAAHVNNPYHQPVIGWMTDVQNLTLNDLTQWYRAWYVPNNAVLVVVGDVNPKKVLYLAKKYFSDLDSAKIPLLKPRIEIPRLGKRTMTVNIPAQLPMLILGYNVPSLKTIDKEKTWVPYALDVAANILSAGDSARFSHDLIRGKQIAVSLEASYNPFRLHDDLFIITGAPSDHNTTKQLQRALLSEITKLQNTLISTDEFERVKAQMIAQKFYQKDSLMYQMYDIGIPESIGLSWKISDNYVNEISKITPKQVQEVAQRYLTRNNLTVAFLKPKTMQNGDQ